MSDPGGRMQEGAGCSGGGQANSGGSSLCKAARGGAWAAPLMRLAEQL
jgi:hypothetical protein